MLHRIDMVLTNVIFSTPRLITTPQYFHITLSNENSFSCDICNKPFLSFSSLTVHMRTDSGDKLFKCSTCEKSFAQSSTSTLTTHMATHSRGKPYKICVCDISFTTSSNLTVHYQIY